MARFKVGEVAIAIHAKIDVPTRDLFKVHGEEVRIIRPLRLRRMYGSYGTRWCYVVLHRGHERRALPEQLRRKEDTILWEDCVFKPDECAVAVSTKPEQEGIACPRCGYAHPASVRCE